MTNSHDVHSTNGTYHKLNRLTNYSKLVASMQLHGLLLAIVDVQMLYRKNRKPTHFILSYGYFIAIHCIDKASAHRCLAFNKITLKIILCSTISSILLDCSKIRNKRHILIKQKRVVALNMFVFTSNAQFTDFCLWRQ